MPKYLILMLLPLLMLVSCGDDDSGKSPVQSEFGESSSGEVDSSSSDKVTEPAEGESSSSSKKIALSSSTPRSDKKSSSSSSKEKKSSSSSKVETSSSKKSSSSSSTPRKDNKSSSSSVKNPEPGEGSSSSESSSSGIVTQNSSSSSENPGPIENSSSSEESSSSLNPVESSSSEMSSSSSPALNSIYDAENNTLTDLRDGHVYKTVTIGTQIWMAENLNYLPKDTAGTFWAGRSVCGGGEYQSLQEGDCSVYGRLYEKNINAYDGFNKDFCPDGWNVPTLEQWYVLIESVGGGKTAGKALKSSDNLYWSDDDLTDSYGFSAISAGYFHERKGYNYRDNELMAVFTAHNFNSITGPGHGNGVRIFDTRDSVQYTLYGDWFYLAVRCIKK